MLKRIVCLILTVTALSAAAEVSESDLVGEWYQSKMSTIDFVNPATGAHANPSGERLNVRFLPDGTFRLGWLLQSSLYNCSSTVFGYKSGIYKVSNSTITLDVRSNTLTSKDNCHPQWNYEKHPPLITTTYSLQMGRSKYGPVLIMRGPDGKEQIYARETGKSLLGE